MKQYYKIINGETVFFSNPLVVGQYVEVVS